ncbi:MAG: SDR family oxidoreductase [Planctomycetes bacterium]|nr:SDR family oxidoreductase [Planctomycetota bacterium]
MKILVLGITGMLGNAMFRYLSSKPTLAVYGAVRRSAASKYFAPELADRLIAGWDAENHDSTIRVFNRVRPDVVVNCVGLVKQLAEADDPLQAIPINSILPHRLAALSEAIGARLVHVSTDCVFLGTRGMYKEEDVTDAKDLYGRTKALGELTRGSAITLRTSIIGHELEGNRSLVGWFLSQARPVKGFRRAIFSGLPTVELSRVVYEYVLPKPDLSGLFHVAAPPIDKYSLLELVAETYGKSIEIVPDENLVIDRSLDASKFREATGYESPDWRELIRRMHEFK